MEDIAYESRTLASIAKVAWALGMKLSIRFVPDRDPAPDIDLDYHVAESDNTFESLTWSDESRSPSHRVDAGNTRESMAA